MSEHESSHLPPAPAENHAPIPRWFLGAALIAAFWMSDYLLLNSGGFRGDNFDPGTVDWNASPTGPTTPPDPRLVGKRLYNANCAQCHQATGLGQAGVYPPLANSEWVIGSKHRLIAILHHGIAGPINVKGNLYNNNMPAWGDSAPVPLKDEQISSILTYIRSEWGNNSDAVTSEEVALIRGTTKDRKAPWSEKELLALPSDLPPPPPGSK